MVESNEHIDFDLAAKYLAEECSAQEMQEFESWLDASPANQHAFEEIKVIWEVNLEEEPQVNVDAAWNKVSSNVSELYPVESAQTKPSFTWAIAASVVLLIGISAAFWFLNERGLNEFSSGSEMASIILDDGSQITLRENSSLHYPENFEGATREVTLTGVGYFEVAADKEHPFIIHTDAGDVQVLGTAFEVNTRDSMSSLIVEVAEGLVQVSNKKATSVERVGAGQKCQLTSDEKLAVDDLDEPAPFFWKDRTIRFKRTQLSKVVTTLEELLRIDIILDGDSIENCELTASFTDEKAETILEVIAMTLGLELEQEGMTFILTGKGC